MLKWRRSLAALLLILILFDAFALGLLWQRKRQAKNKIKFKNELPGIEVVWKDKKGFAQLLEKINFWRKGVLLYGQHQRVKPKQRRDSGDHRQWFEHTLECRNCAGKEFSLQTRLIKVGVALNCRPPTLSQSGPSGCITDRRPSFTATNTGVNCYPPTE